MNGLALSYVNQSRYDKAEPLYIKLLEIRQRLLGDEHNDTLSAMNSVAWWVYTKQGHYDKAEALYAKMLEIRRRVSGDEDPQTLRVMQNLANTYIRQGKHGQAEKLHINVLDIIQRVSGKEHPDTAALLNSLAWFWATCPEEKYLNGAKAIEYATKACELTNWENASYVDTLAAAYAEAGDFDSAVKWQKKAIKLITEENPAEWRVEFTERLELYQAGKAYRQSQ